MNNYFDRNLFNLCEGCNDIQADLLDNLVGQKFITRLLKDEILKQLTKYAKASKLFEHLRNSLDKDFPSIEQALRDTGHTKPADLIRTGILANLPGAYQVENAGPSSPPSSKLKRADNQEDDGCLPNPFKNRPNKNKDETDKNEEGQLYALIINVLRDRPGAEKDTPALEQVLRHCAFDITICPASTFKVEGKGSITDLKGSDISKGVTNFIKKLKNAHGIKGVLVAVMSHGVRPFIKEEKPIYTKNGRSYDKVSDPVFFHFPPFSKKTKGEPLAMDDWFVSGDKEPLSLHDDIIEKFNGKNCDFLHDVPKIFLVNFCRGEKWDTDFASNDDDDLSESTDFEDNDGTSGSSWKHMLISFASYHGHVAIRTDKGTKFIQEFCKVVRAAKEEKDIEEIIKEVNHNVSSAKTAGRGWQTPCLTNVLYWEKKLMIKCNAEIQ